jgi:hypothetical protein
MSRFVPENRLPAERLDVTVVYTEAGWTNDVLRRVAQLAANLRARVRLIVPRVVPHPLPLDEPPIAERFERTRFGCMGRNAPVDTHVQLCYCRDEREALLSLLSPGSLVVVGGLRRWWRSGPQRLARALEREFPVSMRDGRGPALLS